MPLRWKVIAALVLLILMAFAAVYVPVTGLGEIDVNSGRIRSRVIVLGITVRQNLADTPFSRLVSECGLGSTPPSYKPFAQNELGLKRFVGKEFVCYRYGAVMGPLDLFPKILEDLGPMDKARKTEMVAHMLGFLKTKDTRNMVKLMREMMAELESR
jgi:hypothetical protein